MSQGPESCCPPAGTGPIHLNEVQCRGTEKSLWNCPFRNITQEDCKHTEDAAVRCNIPYMGYENLVCTTGGCRLHGAPSMGVGPQRGVLGGGPWDPWDPHLSSSAPHTLPSALGQGLPWELRDFVGGSPCEEGVEGRLWGLWVLCG